MNRSPSIDDPFGERELVERLRAGHDGAYRILVRKFQKRLFAVAFGITRDREESLEIVQDVFVSVFKNIHKFRGDSSLSSWLHRITVNLCLNWKRKWKRRFKWMHRPVETEEGHIYPEAEQSTGDPESDYRQKAYEQKLMEEVGKLPEKIRAAFVLNTFEDLSYDEIAGILGIKRGTVSSRIHTARKYLRKSMGDED